jgi:SAM-dependent methyltransferase
MARSNMHHAVFEENRSAAGSTQRHVKANDTSNAASANSMPNTSMERLHSPKAWKIEDLERMTRARNYFAWQSRLVGREIGRRVVEVGCGVGNFTATLLNREAVIAVDNDLDCLARVRDRFLDRSNLHVMPGDASDDSFPELARFQPDSCVCLNVLEHIEDDEKALRNMAAILSPGGVVVLLLPAFPALYGPIGGNLGHWRRYRRSGVARLAEAAGLRVRRARYMNTIGFFGWWMNARVLRRDTQSAGQIEVFDRYLVPLMSRLENLVPTPFGQSLFVVMEKPESPA